MTETQTRAHHGHDHGAADPHAPIENVDGPDYFEVMHHQDLDLFDRVFHPQSSLYSIRNGELDIRPCAVYREQLSQAEQQRLDR